MVARDILIEMAQSAYNTLQTGDIKDHESGGVMTGSVPTPILVNKIHENLRLAGGPGGPPVDVTVLQPDAPKQAIEDALFDANIGMLDKIRELAKTREPVQTR
jgi:hypothetical protein